jgi:hypothetical protein
MTRGATLVVGIALGLAACQPHGGNGVSNNAKRVDAATVQRLAVKADAAAAPTAVDGIKYCDQDKDCPSGFRCLQNAVLDLKDCMRFCKADTDCLTGQFCVCPDATVCTATVVSDVAVGTNYCVPGDRRLESR